MRQAPLSNRHSVQPGTRTSCPSRAGTDRVGRGVVGAARLANPGSGQRQGQGCRACSGRSLLRMELMVDATKGVGTTMSSSWPCATTAFRSPVARSPSGSLKPCDSRVRRQRPSAHGDNSRNIPAMGSVQPLCRPSSLHKRFQVDEAVSYPSAATTTKAHVVDRISGSLHVTQRPQPC